MTALVNQDSYNLLIKEAVALDISCYQIVIVVFFQQVTECLTSNRKVHRSSPCSFLPFKSAKVASSANRNIVCEDEDYCTFVFRFLSYSCATGTPIVRLWHIYGIAMVQLWHHNQDLQRGAKFNVTKMGICQAYKTMATKQRNTKLLATTSCWPTTYLPNKCNQTVDSHKSRTWLQNKGKKTFIL